MTDQEVFRKLSSILGEKYIVIDKKKLYNYSIDNSTGKKIYPLCVVKPSNTHEVSKIVAFCNSIHKGITTRAGGSSVSGGCMSNSNDIVLSVERLNHIYEINVVDRYVIAGAGVNTQILQDNLKAKGLWFPQNISSAPLSCIGGNVAISSGSPKSLKYGSTKNFVLNLEVVLPNGKIIWTGKNIKKNATGYNLTQLFIGSEGTLGIITKVVLEVIPPKKEVLLMVPFSLEKLLFKFVKDFFFNGYRASSLEFLDNNACNLMYNYLNKKKDYKGNIGGLLWIEMESENDEENLNKAELLWEFISNYTDFEVFIAQSEMEIKTLWEFRKRIGEAALNNANFKDLDIVVPRSKIDVMYDAIKSVCKSIKLKFIVIGHIGDGNFHINIFRDNNLSATQWEYEVLCCTSILFQKAVELGGEISGEHGVGKYNTSAMDKFMNVEKIQLMKQIKEVFDPNKILNLNNIFLESNSEQSSTKFFS